MFLTNKQLLLTYRIEVHEGAKDGSARYQQTLCRTIRFAIVFACIACTATTPETGNRPLGGVDSATPREIGQDTGFNKGVDVDVSVHRDSSTVGETGSQDTKDAGLVPTDGFIRDTNTEPDFADANTDAALDGEENENTSCSLEEVFPRFGSQTWNAIWGSASDDVYVVGDFGAVLHYDGNQWERVRIDTNVRLSDIWGSGKDDIYFVGGPYSGNPSTFHFDGSDWSEIKLDYYDYDYDPGTIPPPWPIAVHGTSPDDVFVTGRDTILHFDGSSWNSVPSEPDDFGVWQDVFACGPEQVFALALNGGGEFKYLYRFDRTSSTFKRVEESVSPFPVEDAGESPNKGFCIAADDIWTLSSTVVAHWNGQQWNISDIQRLATDSPLNLIDIFVTPDDRRFAVGDDGALFYSDSSTFKQAMTGMKSRLHAVWGTDKDHIYAVGERGAVLEGNIEHLEYLYPILDYPISTLLKLESDRVAAISIDGESGSGVEVVIGIEDDWQIVGEAAMEYFLGAGAVGTRADDILIAGATIQLFPYMPISEPTLLRFDGKIFEEVGLTISSDYLGPSCTEIARIQQVGAEVFMVCRNGEVLRREGNVFRSLAPQSACSLVGARNDPFSIWTVAETNMWENAQNDLFVWGFGMQATGGPMPKVTGFGCTYDGADWTDFPNESSYYYPNASLRAVAVWGDEGEIYILYVDERSEVDLDSCAVSIKRFDGVNSTLSAGCDAEAEQPLEPNRLEWIYPGPDDSFFAPVKGGAIYYNGTKWRAIPFGDTWDRTYSQYPFVVFSDTSMYVATNRGSIYHLTCPTVLATEPIRRVISGEFE